MKKGYLITAVVTTAALTNINMINYFAISGYASASVERYQPKENLPPQENKNSQDANSVKVELSEIYRVRRLIAQVSPADENKPFQIQTEEKQFFYSLQLGSFKRKEGAEKFLNKLPQQIKDGAFIYRTDKGFYTVRYGLFDSYELLKDIQGELPISSIIVKTDVSKIAQEKTKIKEKSKDITKIKKPILEKRKEEVVPTEEVASIVPEFEEEEIDLFEEEKIEVPFYKKVIGAVIFLPAYMLTHKQRGFWGKVEFIYKMEDYKDPYNKTKRNSLKQYYELNYEGYVYSPRLLTYRLGGNFTQEDSNITTQGVKSSSTSKLIGYDLELNILKASKFPLVLFLKRMQSPLWYTYYGRTSYIERKTDTFGLVGNVNIANSHISYGYTKTKSKSTGLDFSEDRNSENFSFSYGKSWINKGLNISYQKNIDDYTQRYPNINSYRKVYQDIDNLLMDYRWKVSKKSNLNSNLRYYSNSYSDIKNLTGNVNYLWNPTEKLSTNFSFSATKTDSGNYQLLFLSFNESVSYKINENWNMNHNLLLFTSTGSNTDQKILNTGVNINYNKFLSETFSIFGGTGVSTQLESGNINRVGGTVSLSGGLNKKFSFLNSNFSLSGSISEYNTTKKDKSTTYNINERFNAYLLNNLIFEHSINYYSQNSKYYQANNNFNKTTYDNIEVANGLRYSKLLGWKGRLNSSLGIKYYSGKNRAERVYPYGNFNLSYKFTRRLLYKMSLDVYRDSYYNANYTRFGANLDYRIRSLVFQWDFQYFYEDNQNFGTKQNYITQFKIYRVF